MDLNTVEQLAPIASNPDSVITVDSVSDIPQRTASKLSRVDNVQRLILPKVDALTRSIHEHISEKNTFEMPLGQDPSLNMTIYPNSQHHAFPFKVEVCVDQQTLELQIDKELMDAALSDLGTGAPLELIPDKLLLSLLQSALAPLLSTLSHSLGASVELSALVKNAQTESSVNQLLVKTQYKGMVCQAGLLISAATLPYLKTLLQTCHEGDTPSSPMSNRPVNLSAAIRGIRLSVSDIANLEKDDLILLDKPFDSYLSDILISSGDHALFSAQYEQNTLTICHEIEEHRMHDTLMEAGTSEAESLSEKIKVDVIFELARQKMNLDALNKLTLGKVIDLNKPLSSFVTIRANGTPVAKAELVEIDERVGARITELLISEALYDE